MLPQDAEFYMSGEINRPGRYPIQGNVTLMQGALDGRWPRRVLPVSMLRFIRKSGPVEKYVQKRLEKMLENGEIADPPIQPGDRVHIPKNPF